MPILNRVSEMHAEITAWRRELHQMPELAYAEFRTADYIEQCLRRMNLPVTRPTTTSVVGVLHTGRPGRTLVIRADIDALAIQEGTDLDFAATMNPPLTTMRQKPHDIGRLAAKLIVDRIDGTIANDDAPTTIKVEAELVVRKSTAEPRPA